MSHFSSHHLHFHAKPIPSAFSMKWVMGYAAAYRQLQVSGIGTVHLILN